ncbi:MAG: hypothetical protein WCX73_00525 [Candidatus Pacearchaeota archaeon]
MVKVGRKAQVGIISLILIILIVIILIAIVWNVLVPLIKEKGEDVQFGKFTINLEVKEVILFENGVSMITINRKSGNEELDGLKFVFYDEAGNSEVRDKEPIHELETKTYSFAAIPEIGKISRVGVAPIIKGNLGMLIESAPSDILMIPSGVVGWWRFDDLKDFIGGNECTLIKGGIIDGVLNGEANCDSKGLNLVNNMAISFWVNGNDNKKIITKRNGYEISVVDKKIEFVYGDQQGISDEELNMSWNHVVIDIAPAFSIIYVNNIPKTFSISSFNLGEGNLILNGEIDNLMILNKSITNIEGIYNNQKKD